MKCSLTLAFCILKPEKFYSRLSI